MHMETISSDPAKPSPHEVLNALANKVEFENKLLELCNAQNSLEIDKVFSQTIRSSSDGKDMGESENANLENESSKRLQLLNKIGLLLSQDSQCHNTAEDPDTLRLLNWLASSQADEDINSDDELRRETILSPLMPATTISEVLEKADMEFVSASQQECQDILDSVQDSPDGDCKSQSQGTNKSKSAAMALDSNLSSQLSLKKKIPQVDGSGGCKKQIHHTGKTSKVEKNKGKRPFWGTLPFSLSENVNDGQPADVKVDSCDGEIKIGTETCAGSTIVGCSVRDLMRRKRYHRDESLKVELQHDVKVTPVDGSNNNTISSPKQKSDQQDISPSTSSGCCSFRDSEVILVKDMNLEAFAAEACGKAFHVEVNINLLIIPHVIDCFFQALNS